MLLKSFIIVVSQGSKYVSETAGIITATGKPLEKVRSNRHALWISGEYK